MICPICGYESGVLVNTPDGLMCPRCRDHSSSMLTSYIAESGASLIEARSKLSTASMIALHDGELNLAEILMSMSDGLSQYLDRLGEILGNKK